MSRPVDASKLREMVNDYLDQYGRGVYAAVETACDTAAKQTVKELRKGGNYQTHETGEKYDRGWTSTVQTMNSRIGARIATRVVHNKAVPGLAHLLEFGHAKRRGGRTQAFNYIAPITEEWLPNYFATEVQKELNKSGSDINVF